MSCFSNFQTIILNETLHRLPLYYTVCHIDRMMKYLCVFHVLCCVDETKAASSLYICSLARKLYTSYRIYPLTQLVITSGQTENTNKHPKETFPCQAEIKLNSVKYTEYADDAEVCTHLSLFTLPLIFASR